MSKTFKSAVRMPGFFIGPAFQFQSGLDAAFKILVGAEGNTNMTAGELRVFIDRRAAALFATVVDKELFYMGTRGDDIFWNVILKDWVDVAEDCGDITADQLRKVVQDLATARRFWGGSRVSTKLTEQVDKFNTLYNKALSDRDAGKFSLAIREPVNDAAVALGDMSLGPAATTVHGTAEELGGTSIQPQPLTGPFGPPTTGPERWPPARIREDDLPFLANNTVMQAVQGVTADNPGQQPTAWPHVYMMPLQMRVFLAWLILTTRHHSVSVACYMAPIWFLDTLTRKVWFPALDNQSKLTASLEMFLEYAGRAFDYRHPVVYRPKKFVVVGLLTPLLISGLELTEAVKTKFNYSFARPWAERYWRTARMGMAIVLRKVKRNGVEGYQYLLFDPSHCYQACKEAASQHDAAADKWCKNAAAMVKEWAEESGRLIFEAWEGGYIGDMDPAHDSVGLAASFMAMVAGGRGLPEMDADKDEWEKNGWVKVDLENIDLENTQG